MPRVLREETEKDVATYNEQLNKITSTTSIWFLSSLLSTPTSALLQLSQWKKGSGDETVQLTSTYQSQSHASGCHVTNRVCDAAEFKGKLITATKM